MLVHPDPRAVLGVLAAHVYGRPSETLAVIGVTGTSGKTTTTYLIEAGLRAAGRTAGLIGTVGVRIDGADIPSALTTPEAPALQALLAVMARARRRHRVMEVSSHALTLGRVDGVRFAVGGFTNLSRDHLDFHPTMADYFEAKARLFDPASPRHAAHLGDLRRRRCGPRDGRPRRRADHGRALPVRPAGPSRTSSTSPTAVRSSPPSIPPACTTGSGSGCRVATTSPIALWRWRSWTLSGWRPSRPHRGCVRARVPGRLEPIDRGQGFLALVDYAHKPGALRAVLDTLRVPRTTKRIAMVFGAGGDRDPGKRAADGCRRRRAGRSGRRHRRQSARRGSRRDQGRDPGRRGAGASAEVVEIGDRGAAIDHAVAWARPGDVVLIAGKGHETGQTPRADPAVRRPHGARRSARGTRVIDLTVAQIAEIVGGELADISAAEAAATARHRHRRIRFARSHSRRAVSGAARCARRRPRSRGGRGGGRRGRGAGRTSGRGARRSWCDPTRPVTAAPACSSTTATVRVRPCWPRWRSWPRRWPRAWSSGGLTIVGVTGSSGKTSTKDLLAAVLSPLG